MCSRGAASLAAARAHLMQEVEIFEEKVTKVKSESLCDSTLISDLKAITARLAAVNSNFEESTDAGSQSEHDEAPAPIALSKSAKRRARKAARDAAYGGQGVREVPVPAPKVAQKLAEKLPVQQAEELGPAQEQFETSQPLVQKDPVAGSVHPRQERVQAALAKPRINYAYKGKVMVPVSSFGSLVGKDGLVIKSIKEKLGVHIDMPWVSRDDDRSHAVKIKGVTRAAVCKCEEVIRCLAQYHHHELTHAGQSHVEVEAPAWAHRHIVGAGGSEMRRIEKDWSVKLHLPQKSSTTESILIVGLPDNVAQAAAHIRQLMARIEQVAARRG